MPFRLLAVASAAAGLDRLDLEREWQQLADIWAGVGSIAPQLMWATDPHELRQELLRGKHQVLHFMGHGDFNPGSGEGWLCFPGDPYLRVGGEELAAAIGDLDLQLVVINACSTARLGAETGISPFAGVAAALVEQGCSASSVLLACQRREMTEGVRQPDDVDLAVGGDERRDSRVPPRA